MDNTTFEQHRQTWVNEWPDKWRPLDIDFETYMVMKGMSLDEYKSMNAESPSMNKIGIDVGACIGESLDQFKGFHTVYAIEPGPEEFFQLERKETEFKNYIPINSVVGLENGEVEFITYHNGRFSSMLEFNKDTKFYKYCEDTCESFDDLKEKINVKCIRLDSLIEENNIKEIEYIKIDTQGTDLDVVKSLGDKISIVKKISLEIQLEELYKGSSTKDEVFSYMFMNNFRHDDDNNHYDNGYEKDFVFINNRFY